MPFFTYILRCSDHSLYIGHTHALSARLRAHNDGLGARFTALRRPVSLAWSESFPRESDAIARERQLKKWSRAKKEALVASHPGTLRALSQSREQAIPLD